MQKAGMNNNDLFFEYLDLSRMSDKGQREALAGILRYKYSKIKIDLIITVHAPAMLFLRDEAKDIFAGVPAISSMIMQQGFRHEDAEREIIQLFAGLDVRGTLEAALRLFPETRHVLFVSGTFQIDAETEREARESIFPHWQNKLDFEYSSKLSVEEMMERAANLPPDSIIIYWNVLRDKTGRTFIPTDVGRMIAKAANAPVFCLYDTLMGLGVVGGSLQSYSAGGIRTAELALDILSGKIDLSRQAEPVTVSPVPMFDWNQLERWGGDNGKIPEGSTVINRPESFWDHYGWYLIFFITVLVIESLLIIGLLIHRRRRKAAEMSLRKAEEKYRSIFEGALEGIYEATPDGRLLTANASFSKMLGYDSPEEVLSLLNDVRKAWVDPTKRVDYIQKLEMDGIVIDYECQLYRKDGSTVWVSLNSKLVCGPDGKTHFTSGFMQDISERRRAGEAIKKSEAKYRQLHEGMMDGFALVDMDGTIRECNETYQNMTGYSLEELLGLTYRDLTPERWHAFEQKIIEEQVLVNGYSEIYQKEYRRKDGTILPVELRTILSKDETGANIGMWAVLRDITKRKRIEEELRNSEERYRALVETSSDWVWEVDADSKYSYVDPKVSQILGYLPEEILGLTPFQLMPQDDAKRIKAIFSAIAAEKRPFSGLLNCNIHKDGKLIMLETSGVPILGPDEELLGYRGMDRDVTERSLAEKALRQSEERFRRLIEDSPIGIGISRDGLIVYVNKKYLEMFRYQSVDELCGQPVINQWVPELREQIADRTRRRRRGLSVPAELIGYALRKDGSQFHAHVHVSTVQFPEGSSHIAFFSDISERVKAEEEIRKNEERLRITLEANSEGIWDWDIASGNAYFSPRYSGMLGYEPDEFPKDYAGWKQLIHPEDFDRIHQAHMAHINNREEFCVEFRMLKKSGDWCWIRSRGTVIQRDSDDKAIRMVGTHLDITQSKMAKEALHESDETNRATFEQAAVGIAHLGIDGGWLRVNDRLCRILGYTREELMGLSFQDITHPDDLADDIDYLRRVLSGEINNFSWEKRYLQKDGSSVWVNLAVSLVRLDTGEPRHFIAVFQDITERVEAEEELKRYRIHLEEIIEERTAELVVAKERAEAADHIKSVFLATMSHELRTPLNSIIGFTGALQQELSGPLNQEQKKQLGMVRASGSHLLNLINDVLDISKIEAGHLELAIEPFDLRALIQKTMQAVRPIAEKKCLVLELEIAPDVGLISSDRRRVEQILLNLLSNAVKFTDEGRIRVTCSSNSHSVLLGVSDTGIGIRSKDIDRLFKPFEQIHTGAARNFEGTGLGLSICKKLLGLLGGKIAVASEWGKGSTFSFTLPIQRGEE